MTWGCYKPERTRDSGYSNTVEGFDNNYGTVVWRKAQFAFPKTTTTTTINTNAHRVNNKKQHADGIIVTTNQATTTDNVTSTTQQEIIFGVLDRSLLDGSGGVFFGLIKTISEPGLPYTSDCVITFELR